MTHAVHSQTRATPPSPVTSSWTDRPRPHRRTVERPAGRREASTTIDVVVTAVTALLLLNFIALLIRIVG